MTRRFRHLLPTLRGAAATMLLGLPLAASAQTTLINGKKITLPPVGTITHTLPGAPVVGGNVPNIGSNAMNLITTPDGKFAIATDMGYREYLSSVDTSNGNLISQISYGGSGSSTGLFYGLVFSPIKNSDNTWTLYAAQGSVHTAVGTGAARTYATTLTTVKVDATTGVISSTATPLLFNPVLSTYNSTSNRYTDNNKDFTAGLAISADGRYLYVANHAATATNAPGSLIIVDLSLSTPAQIGRFDFTQANGATATVSIPATFGGGTASNFPYAVTVKGSTVYVAATSDNVYAINVANPSSPTLTAQIATGLNPLGLLINGDTLYVSNAHSDTVSVVDTTSNTKIGDINLRPNGALNIPGVTPNQMAISPDKKTLYVALSDFHAVALIDVATNKIKGEIPTGWYPSSVVATTDGKRILVANARGTITRYPNPGQQVNTPRNVPNQAQYSLNQIESDVETIQVPNTLKLLQYTNQVIANNRITPNTDNPAINPLFNISKAKGGITHVFYIIRENRTYDQVLGDLNTPAFGNKGNGDPSLVLFGNDVTPNIHALAQNYVLLDNFFDVGDASMEGWDWTLAAISTQHMTRNQPYNYSGRGANYDSEGTVNNYPVAGLPAGAAGYASYDSNGNAIVATNLPQLPAILDLGVTASGRIHDSMLAAGNTVRNYGSLVGSGYPLVAGLQPGGHYDATMGTFSPAVAGNTDLDFSGYDNSHAESPAPYIYSTQNPSNTKYLPIHKQFGKYLQNNRFDEWNREFSAMIANDPTGNSVPNFEYVRFGRDHTQGINANGPSAKAEVADNDYAVGKLVEAISNSPIWAHSAIFVLEDDAQNGPDHVDSHRSIGFVISPYIKKGTISSKFCNTTSFLHTMELLLNAKPLTQYDAIADYVDAWDTAPNNNAPYSAILPAKEIVTESLAPGSLYAKANIKEFNRLMNLAMKMDWANADANDPAVLNDMIWKSVKGLNSKMPAPVSNPTVAAIRKKNAAIKAKAKLASGRTTKAAKTAKANDDDD